MNNQNKVALKTLAMKAKVANFIRKELYKARLDQITRERKIELFDQIFKLNLGMHNELFWYKEKRKDQKKLLEKRLSSPQTKTMLKKLRGKVKKDLVVSK
jgi:hypothetical protein